MRFRYVLAVANLVPMLACSGDIGSPGGNAGDVDVDRYDLGDVRGVDGRGQDAGDVSRVDGGDSSTASDIDVADADSGDTEPGDPWTTPVVRQGIIAFSGGETGAIQWNATSEDGWRPELPPAPYDEMAVTVVDGPTYAGAKAIRIRYEKGWPLRVEGPPGKIRAEIKRPNGIQLIPENEYWWALALFVPDTAENRKNVNSTRQNNHAFQWHYGGLTGGCGMNVRNGQWQFSFGSVNERPIGVIPFGVWTTFVLHAKLTDQSDGWVRMWVNPTRQSDPKVIDYIGRTNPVNNTHLNPKIGIYKGLEEAWDDVNAVEYVYDEYRTGDATSDFRSVLPGP